MSSCGNAMVMTGLNDKSRIGDGISWFGKRRRLKKLDAIQDAKTCLENNASARPVKMHCTQEPYHHTWQAIRYCMISSSLIKNSYGCFETRNTVGEKQRKYLRIRQIKDWLPGRTTQDFFFKPIPVQERQMRHQNGCRSRNVTEFRPSRWTLSLALSYRTILRSTYEDWPRASLTCPAPSCTARSSRRPCLHLAERGQAFSGLLSLGYLRFPGFI